MIPAPFYSLSKRPLPTVFTLFREVNTTDPVIKSPP